ncbi:MAG TPA: oligosaccharide flippase family protein [Patescibacteria group bacterium]|jgi:O-antigen/teichoic acid export membrane protein|nr:oligosaccharide flippase family protein [Patescibacteria group bacterium]
MEEVDIAVITKRSIRGVFALTSRTFVIQIVSFLANFLLTIFLSPAIFGVYFVVSAAIAFLSYFSDIGLAAALIQKKEAITREDLKTTFTLQQILVVSVVLIALFLARPIANFYHLEQEGIYLFQALAIAFFLSSLKTIPSIILERDLRFEKLVIPQIVETFFFSIVVVILAIKGFGVYSFTYAVLARGISGVIAIYIISPWKIGFGFSKESARKLLSFGIPFQLNSFLALIKDDLFIAYLGKALPLAQVGYIGFAQKWAFAPLRLIMDNVIRITFPSFSRLQNEKEVLERAIEKSIFAACFLIFPALVGLVTLSPYFIHLIPKYLKWEPALLSLALFAIGAALSSISTPLTNALNAIGKIKISLYLMVGWTIATWVLTPILIVTMGFNGVAAASALIACSVVLVVYLAKKYVKFNVFAATMYPFLAAAIMGIVIYFLSPILVRSLISLIFMILLGAVLYFLCIFLFARNEVLADARLVISHLRR